MYVMIELCEIHKLLLLCKQKQRESLLDIVKSKEGIIHQLNLQIFVEL